MTFTLIPATQLSHSNRQNFLIIENTIFEFLQTEQAEEESGLSGAKLLTIYTNLRYALTRFGTKPYHLKIEGVESGDTVLTPWAHLCQITKCASATLSKALTWFEKTKLINRQTSMRNGLPLLISFNLPEDSFRPKQQTAPPQPIPPRPEPPQPASPEPSPLPTSFTPTQTSRIEADTSNSEAFFNRKENLQNNSRTAPLRGDVERWIRESEDRLTRIFWGAVDDMYQLQIRHNAQAARVGAATVYRELHKTGILAKQVIHKLHRQEDSDVGIAETKALFLDQARRIGDFQKWKDSLSPNYTITPEWEPIFQHVRENL